MSGPDDPHRFADDTDVDIDDLEGDELHRLRRDLEALLAHVHLLTQAVAHAGFGTGEQGRASPPAWVWTSLSEDEAALAWAAMTGWVDLLVDRYGLHETVPACWPAHPPMVEELTALRAAWLAAYTSGARPEQPVAWHDAFDRVLDRIRRWNRTGCAGHHRQEPTGPPSFAEGRSKFVAADLATRCSRRVSDSDEVRGADGPNGTRS